MDDVYFVSLMEDVPRGLTARNVKMWQNYCAFRAAAHVLSMPKMNDDRKYQEMETAYAQHAEMLINGGLNAILPVGMDIK